MLRLSTQRSRDKETQHIKARHANFSHPKGRGRIKILKIIEITTVQNLKDDLVFLF